MHSCCGGLTHCTHTHRLTPACVPPPHTHTLLPSSLALVCGVQLGESEEEEDQVREILEDEDEDEEEGGHEGNLR